MVGMVLETLLILNYQSKNGVLFQNIGILLMMFMIGLTLGAFVVNKYFTYIGGYYLCADLVFVNALNLIKRKIKKRLFAKSFNQHFHSIILLL